MDLGTVFKFSLYGLTALVGLILGAAEGEGVLTTTLRSRLFLPYLSVPIVLVSYLLTERRTATSNGFGINSVVANIFGIIALIATVIEFTGVSKRREIAGGNSPLALRHLDCSFPEEDIAVVLVFDGPGDSATGRGIRVDE